MGFVIILITPQLDYPFFYSPLLNFPKINKCKGIVNLISGDSCLQIDRSTAGKDHSLKELFCICNPHILERILRSCFKWWNLAIFLHVQSGNQIQIVIAIYYLNQCLNWFRYFLVMSWQFYRKQETFFQSVTCWILYLNYSGKQPIPYSLYVIVFEQTSCESHGFHIDYTFTFTYHGGDYQKRRK